MKGAMKAAAIGATLSAFFYLAVTWGLDLGFRARTRWERRREAQERNV